nr:MAG TPA: YvrJ protein family protein [Caudoviricetes sp.]
MDFNQIISSIANLGFPAILCVLMFWKMDKQDENYKNVMASMEKTINDNTLAITKFIEKVDK